VTDTSARHPYIEGKRSLCCTHPGCTDVYDLDGTHPQPGDPGYPALADGQSPRRITGEPPGWEGTRATHDRATAAFRPTGDVATAVMEGWWHPNVKSGQVHDHPEAPGRGWSHASHRLCEPVYTHRAVAHATGGDQP
jgi:hypothetical protein